MKQKYISLITQTVVVAIAAVMLVIAQGFKDLASLHVYVPSSYYPSLVCILIIVFGIWGIIEDVQSIKKSGAGDVFTIGITRNLLLTVGMVVFVLLLWQFLDLFYPAVFIATGVLTYFFKPRTTGLAKHISYCVMISAILFSLFYVIFDLLLQVRF